MYIPAKRPEPTTPSRALDVSVKLGLCMVSLMLYFGCGKLDGCGFHKISVSQAMVKKKIPFRFY
jgi:hypothetical protein